MTARPPTARTTEPVTSQLVDNGRLRLTGVARATGTTVAQVRAIRDVVREHDRVTSAARRRRRSRGDSVERIAAGIAAQVRALAARLDPEDPAELAHLTVVLAAAAELRDAALLAYLTDDPDYASVGRALGISRQAVRDWHIHHTPTTRRQHP